VIDTCAVRGRGNRGPADRQVTHIVGGRASPESSGEGAQNESLGIWFREGSRGALGLS